VTLAAWRPSHSAVTQRGHTAPVTQRHELDSLGQLPHLKHAVGSNVNVTNKAQVDAIRADRLTNF